MTGKVAGVLSLAGFVPYILAILRGKTKPTQVTWLVWTIVELTLGAIYYASGARSTIWVQISNFIGPLVICILAIKYNNGGWTPYERACLRVSLFCVATSIMLLWLFKTLLIALLVALLADFIASMPTIRNSYHKPEQEDRVAWILFLAGDLINLFAIKTWSPEDTAYLIYAFLSGGIITTLVFTRPRNQRD